MTSPTDPLPPDPPAVPGPVTSLGAGVAIALLVAVLVVAARSAPGEVGPRTGRRLELTELIQVEQARADRLSDDVRRLRAEVEAVRAASGEAGEGRRGGRGSLDALQREVAAVTAPAGVTPLAGPGVVVTLSDSGAPAGSVADSNDLVVHEQDLQAVVNALWAGGADGMTVAGQRVVATTAIRCVGNVLLLGGRTHSPPYVVEAVGDPAALRSALDGDPTVTGYRRAARDFGLGFEVLDATDLLLPGEPESGRSRATESLSVVGP